MQAFFEPRLHVVGSRGRASRTSPFLPVILRGPPSTAGRRNTRTPPMQRALSAGHPQGDPPPVRGAGGKLPKPAPLKQADSVDGLLALLTAFAEREEAFGPIEASDRRRQVLLPTVVREPALRTALCADRPDPTQSGPVVGKTHGMSMRIGHTSCR